MRRGAMTRLALATVAPIVACTPFTSSGEGLSSAEGPSADGGIESAADAAGDAHAASPCAAPPPDAVFCDDFEREDVQGAWDVRFTGNATLELVASPLGGRELHASFPATSAGADVGANLTKAFAAKVTTVRLSFSLALPAAPSSGLTQLMTLAFPPSGGANQAIAMLVVKPDAVVLAEQVFSSGAPAPYVEHTLDPPIRFGTRQRIEIDVHLAMPPRLTLTVDDVIAFDGPANPAFRSGAFSEKAGVSYAAAPAGPLDVRIDDLLLRAN